MGVEIVDSIDELLKRVDVVLLESVDGRPHLAQARPVIAAGKPLFIDKPMAASLADAMQIFRLAKETERAVLLGLVVAIHVRAFRRCATGPPGSATCAAAPLGGPPARRATPSRSVLVRNPRRRDALHHHGPGLQDGRSRGSRQSGRRVEGRSRRSLSGEEGLRRHGRGHARRAARPAITTATHPLVVEIVKFFKTGKPPVNAEETLEILAFMEAAEESKHQGGKPVTIESVMKKAEAASVRTQ